LAKTKVLLEKKEILGVAQPRKFDLDPSCYCLVTTQVDTKLQGAIDYGYISIDMACTRMLLERKNVRKINVAMAAGYCSRLRSGMNLQKTMFEKSALQAISIIVVNYNYVFWSCILSKVKLNGDTV